MPHLASNLRPKTLQNAKALASFPRFAKPTRAARPLANLPQSRASSTKLIVAVESIVPIRSDSPCFNAGICVALTPATMKLSEAITIYLAAGASFGVYNFLREQNPASRFHTFVRAARAAILWPLAAAKILRPRQRPNEGRAAGTINDQASAQFVERIGQAKRKLLASLYRLFELLNLSSGGEREKMESASRTVRETVEKYVELTMVAAVANADAPPTGRELELFRIAGRKGDDLLLAGRCIHRRNAARLVAHQARARTELLHALAEIREVVNGVTASTNVVAARHLSVETLRFYACAFDLLSLLEDESAAIIIARLLDAECARLRRLEALSRKESQTGREERCPTQTQPIRLSGLEQSMKQSAPFR